jgi:hypothetical protein
MGVSCCSGCAVFAGALLFACSPSSLYNEAQCGELAGAIAQYGPVIGHTPSSPVKFALQAAPWRQQLSRCGATTLLPATFCCNSLLAAALKTRPRVLLCWQQLFTESEMVSRVLLCWQRC